MRRTKTICLIEDDPAIHDAMTTALQTSGYEVHSASDGLEGKRLAVQVDCDLMLLDLILPGCSGLEILAEVRLTRPTLPVIIMTALGDEDDRIRGLKLGADDYVVKPFSIKELLARMEAVMRRSAERPQDVRQIAFTGGSIDLERSEIQKENGDRIDLSERELSLLRYLAGNRGRAISRDELLERVWRMNSGAQTRTIDMHIARLREKLELNPAKPSILLTVRGKGYMFEPRVAK